MPSAPASIANSAARTGSGRAPPRALRSVATWSTFTPRRRGEAFDIEDILEKQADHPHPEERGLRRVSKDEASLWPHGSTGNAKHCPGRRISLLHRSRLPRKRSVCSGAPSPHHEGLG